MSPIAPALAQLTAEIAERSLRLDRPAAVDPRALDRRGHLALGAPGLWSPNRACRLVQAADGWIAVNLARPDDLALVPAWLEADVGDDPWPEILARVRQRPWRGLVAQARLLGLPIAGVGEAEGRWPPLRRMAAGVARRRDLTVIDLSALWAGPLCGAVLAAAGGRVTKVESLTRPDPVRAATPGLFAALNGAKAHRAIDFSDPDALARLAGDIAQADVLITSARPRAFDALGLAPDAVFAANPGLVWVAVCGYGWRGEAADWVAFGDDAAAAGGLVRWTRAGAPRFMGDALADPITGLAAAAGALAALEAGGGFLVDAGLAPSAAAARAAGC